MPEIRSKASTYLCFIFCNLFSCYFISIKGTFNYTVNLLIHISYDSVSLIELWLIQLVKLFCLKQKVKCTPWNYRLFMSIIANFNFNKINSLMYLTNFGWIINVSFLLCYVLIMQSQIRHLSCSQEVFVEIGLWLTEIQDRKWKEP